MARVGPTSGPAPAMAAKWWPNSTQRWVGTKSRPLLRRSAGVARVRVGDINPGLDPLGVEAVAQHSRRRPPAVTIHSELMGSSRQQRDAGQGTATYHSQQNGQQFRVHFCLSPRRIAQRSVADCGSAAEGVFIRARVAHRNIRRGQVAWNRTTRPGPDGRAHRRRGDEARRRGCPADLSAESPHRALRRSRTSVPSSCARSASACTWPMPSAASSSGDKVGVFACQEGPGIENAFGAVAQAWSAKACRWWCSPAVVVRSSGPRSTRR